MKSFINHKVTVFLLLFAVGMNAPAALLEDENIIWKSGPYQYFKYAELDTQEFGPNDHPVDLDAEKLKEVLESLEFRSGDYFETDDERDPVFSLAQARRMSNVFAKALRNAKPDQDIIFALQKTVSKLLFLTDQALMSGRAFYKDGKLNIIIDQYEMTINEEFQRVYDTSGQLSPYQFTHGSRTSSAGNIDKSLVNIAGVSNKAVKNEPRQDWFVIDIPKAYAAIQQQQRQAEQQSGEMSSEAAREMRLEAARMKKQQRELKLEMARMREQMKSNNDGDSSGGETPEERLKTLDNLLEEGLISKEEYQSKREQILKDL